ncbi:MAG TPA: helix-turn-helix domain-containing protein [Pyrinomonadaceae bacterium]|jgi:cytoskeletal protein RodZ
MSLSLGEKLRQAREERGISISEVAEQTRISPLYLKSIEKDDYKALPGGIFNKGFLRSFARYIGFDEEEALADYAQLIAEDAVVDESDRTFHRPQVMTDDVMSQSVAPTLLVVAVILAGLIGAVYLLARYLSSPSAPTSKSNTLAVANTNSDQANANSEVPTAPASSFSVELKAIQEPVWVRYTTEEGAKERTLSPNETLSVDVKDAFQMSFARVKASNLQLSINGKRINVPTTGAKGNIEIEVNKSNVSQIVQTGEIGGETATPVPAPTATTRPSLTPRPTPKPTTSPVTRPSVRPVNAATPKRPAQ